MVAYQKEEFHIILMLAIYFETDTQDEGIDSKHQNRKVNGIKN